MSGSDRSAPQKFWKCLAIPVLVASLAFHRLESATAQPSDPVVDREQETADRYLQVLLRRPRPGVAMDRVYGFHLQNESLDTLRDRLLNEASGEDAGRRRMLWGLIELQRGRPADAATVLAEAADQLPGDSACCYYLGRAALAIGDTERAVEALERAIDRGPARVEALPVFTELGRIYSRGGYKEKARSVWTRLETVFPGDTRVGSQIAKTLAEEGQFEDARERYRKLAEQTRKPDEKVVFSTLSAELLRNMGRADEATGELESILARLRPGSWLHTDVRNRIESGFLKSGNYDALAEYYRRAREKDPDDLTAGTRLSRVLVLAGRLNEAQEVLTESVERAPEDTATRLALVDVLVARRESAAAAEQLSELSRRDPGNPDLLIRWGQVLLDETAKPLEQRRGAAAEVWLRLADQRSDDAVTLSQVADLLRGIERGDQAIELYEKAVDADPAVPQYREYLGEYLYSLDRKQEAIDVWKSIAEGGRRGRDSLVRLAEILTTFERPDLALNAWREASEFDLLFAQELRFADQLVEAKRHDEALTRLDVAASLAETPEERDQLLQKRIEAYQASGTLGDQIRKVADREPSVGNLRTLALMHSAAGDLVEAERAISKALELSPEDTTVLLVAADLAERENRLGDAAAFFDDLSVSDQRYRTNHLQRVAGLRVRLGQFDQAMEVCQAIIDANPASSESYQFLARTAFEIGRDEEGVAALRRAMSVAPRDNSPRRMLASHYAERFRTDEAIELYWQTYRLETKPEDQRSVIRSLAPLYDRKNEMETLISRIDEVYRQEGGDRLVPLAKAAAYESVQDYGSAAGVIEELLVSQPGDVSLLEMMVRLSDVADDIEKATEYQRRICDLASTAENRLKLMRFQIESGAIDASDAVAKRLSLVSDSEQLGRIIRSTLDRGDLSSARLICEQALKNDPDLWDVRAILMQLLLADSGKSPDKIQEDQSRALALASELKKLNLPGDASPPTAKKAKAVGSVGSAIAAQTSPLYWSQSVYTLGRAMKVGRYAKNTYSSSSTLRPNPVLCFGQAKVMANAVTMLVRAIGQSPEEGERRVWEQYEEEFGDDDIETVSEPIRLWEMQSALYVVNTVLAKPASNNGYTTYLTGRVGSPEDRNERLLYDQMRIWWRLAEIDRDNGAVVLLSLLGQRNVNNAKPDKKFEPLTEERLATLMRVNRQVQKHGLQNARVFGITSGAPRLQFLSTVAREVQLAEKPELAEQLLPDDLGPESSYDEIMGAILVSLRLGKPDHAEGMVDLLIPAARREIPRTTPAVFGRSAYQNGGHPENVTEFKRAHQKVMADAEIIRWIHRRKIPTTKRQALGNGLTTAYVPTATSAISYSVSIPLSMRLMDAELANGVAAFTQPLSKNPGPSRQRKVRLDESLINHLNQKLEGASEEELRTRRIVAAYAHWWADRPEACFESLGRLCQDYPGDVELQIEQARLAAVLQKPALALELLDTFHPLDSQMLVRKEMAAMNLAAETENTERAKAAATRLFGMRLDTKTQLMLVDQLRQLGLERESVAMLQRTRSGRSADLGTQLQVAQAFLSSGDKEAASEVAYGAFRRMMSARKVRGSSSTLKRKAVSILKSTDRLDPLVEQYERRVEASPRARRPRQQLAEIYDAVGRREDAAKMRVEMADNLPEGVPRLIARADALAQANKHADAVGLYLDALDKEPPRLASEYRKLINAASRAGEDSVDLAFQRLIKLPVEVVPPNRMDDLVRMGGNDHWSKAKAEFVGHLLKAPHAGPDLYSAVSTLAPERQKDIPDFKESILRFVCSPAAFSLNSPVWRIRTRRAGGEAVGPLAETMRLFREDPAAGDRFRAAAKEAEDGADTQSMARFLTAVLDVDRPGRLESSLRQMREAITAETAPQQDIESETKTKTPKRFVDAGVLWQAGQLLESQGDAPDAFVIDLYREAIRSGSTGGTPETSLEHRLVRLLNKNGRSDESRKILWSLWKTKSAMVSFRSNRGFSELQRFQLLEWLIERMKEMGLDADVMLVSASGLRDPAAFDRIVSWSQGKDYRRLFQSEFDRSRKAVTPDMAADYLLFQATLWEKEPGMYPLNLMDSPPSSLADSEMPSSLAFVLRKAVEDSGGRSQVQSFLERVSKLSDQKASWQWAGLELMTACYLESDAVSSLEEKLFDRLLEKREEVEPGQKEVNAAPNAATLLRLFPVAEAASNIGDSQGRQTTERLLDYIRETAIRLNHPTAIVALKRLGADPSAAINEMLDGIESGSQERTAQQKTSLSLSVASTAAKVGESDGALRGVLIGLGAGPPLAKTTGSAGAFTMGRASSTSASLVNSRLASYAIQLRNVYAEIERRWSVQLWMSGPKDLSERQTDLDGNVAGSVPLDWEEWANGLEQVLMPDSSPRPIYLYCSPIITRGNWVFKTPDVPDVSSLAMAWAHASTRAASEGGTGVDERWSRMQKLAERSEDKREISVAMLNLAVISGDAAKVGQALVQFQQAVDSDLPPIPQAKDSETAEHPARVRVPLSSQSKADLASLVLHGVWPIVTTELAGEVVEDDLKTQMAAISADLLQRVELLVQSDASMYSRMSKFMRRVTLERLQLSAQAGDSEAIVGYIRDAIAEIDNDVYDVRADEEAEKRDAFKKLATRLMDDGMTEYAGPVFARLARTTPPGERSYTSTLEPRICLELSSLKPLPRLKVLRRLTFGDSDDHGVQFIEGLLRYEVPPPMVRRQLPRLQDVMNLRTGTEDYPVVNSLVMLVETAIETGEAPALRRDFETRIGEVGDRASVAVALLTLAEAESGIRPNREAIQTVRPVLNAVSERLLEGRPKVNDREMAFPALETLLAVRAYRAGVPRSIVEPLIRSSKVFAVRQERNELVSAVARATAKMGLGRTAGGQAKSPLHDFQVVSLPSRGQADNERLKPLFAENAAGWVSGTSGYEGAHLMFSYPLVGEFEFAARIKDGAWGEADLAYGGIVFGANGWNRSATLLGMGGRGQVEFPVPSIRPGKDNEESVRVSSDGVRGVCNGEAYVFDRATHSFPFVSVHHQRYRTTQFREIRLKGHPEIPRQVNMIDPSMRGWGVLTRGATIPWMLMPIGPRQNRATIEKFREQKIKELAEGPLVGSWSVRDGQLYFRSRPVTDRSSDPASQIQYVRPLQEGETIEMEFYWAEGQTEMAPTIGRTVLRFEDSGVTAEWIGSEDDLASVEQLPWDGLSEAAKVVAAKSKPDNDAWNRLRLTRRGDQISLSLNGKAVVAIPVRGHERVGVHRDQKTDLHLRKMELTGDWPEAVPEAWLQQAEKEPASPQRAE